MRIGFIDGKLVDYTHTRRKIMKITSFNQNWMFRNELKHMPEKEVNLPHDAMQTEKRLADGKTGAAGAFFPGGKYVYRKKIFGVEEYRDKSVFLEFEGIYMKSTVYLNDKKVGGWIYGYTGFYVELTDGLRIGKENEIKVEVNNTQTPNSRWYSGSGIYRNVNLIVGDKRHIKLDGIKVMTKTINPVVLSVQTEVENGSGLDIKVEIYQYNKGFDTTGKVKELDERDKLIQSGSGADCCLEVPDAKLWDDEHPNLYRIRVMLMDKEYIIDEQTLVTGIRLLDWSAENGFQINEKMVKLRGGCIHHDNGILGACAPYAAEYRKAAVLKKAGFNAIRSAHNPISKGMLAACDELGIYIMDEAFDQWRCSKLDYDYSLYFDSEWKKDCYAMVMKDRNHPSVIMYSIGNEIGDTGKSAGAELSRMLSGYFHELDVTRPTINGINPVVSAMGGTPGAKSVSETDVVDPYEETKGSQATASLLANMIVTVTPFISKMLGKPKKVEKLLKPCFDEVDIVGYNYAEQCYAPHHEIAPERIMVGSETYPQNVAERWPFIMLHNYVIGDFMWTAMDYLGEAGIGVPIYGSKHGGFNRPYPCISGGCGAIDLLGHIDTEAVYAAIAWGKYDKPYIAVRPINHSGEKYFFGMWRGTDAFACWTFPGYEGKKAEIEIYSIGESVELFLNGKSLGRKKLVHAKAYFETSYKVGTLEAVSYDLSGKKLAVSRLVSAGKETNLTVTPERTKIYADGEDMVFVSVSLTDNNGIEKNLEARKVMAEVTGAAALVAIGSANPVTEESYLGNTVETWNGRMGFWVRSNAEKGLVNIQVKAEDLRKEIEIYAV